MLIPYNTDAPLYHPPIATVALIVVNCLLYVPIFRGDDPYAMREHHVIEVQEIDWEDEDWNDPPDNSFATDPGEAGMESDPLAAIAAQRAEQFSTSTSSADPAPAAPRTTIWRLLTLEFGKFRPWQWLTANYMHADLFHLLGNMFVLWGFGLVVEGKVGWWRFLLIYNLIGILGCGFVQLIMLLASGGIGLGASLAIFGLVVIALVWAPSNDMQCVFMFGLRPILFEASILTIAMGALFLQVAISALHILTMTNMGLGLRMTSEILHLIGGALGFGVGVAMLRKKWVDCENWDMFSVWAGKHVKTIEEDRQDVTQQLERIRQQEQRRLAPVEEVPLRRTIPTDQQETLLNQFRTLVKSGQPVAAWEIFCRGERECLGWQVPEKDFVAYITALRKQQQWEHAVGAMQEYLQRYMERETTMRLALAQLYLVQLGQPREARQVLKTVNDALLGEKEKAVYQQLIAACRSQLPKQPGRTPPATS